MNRNSQPPVPIRSAPTQPVKEMLRPIRTAPSAPPSAPPAQLKSSASFISLNQDLNKMQLQESVIQPNAASTPNQLSEWISKSFVKPQAELTVQIMPSLMASFEKFVFCMDLTSNVTIYEWNNSMELKEKNKIKISVSNPKAIAANNEYFVVSYSGALKKDQLKGIWKNLPQTGVISFTRQENVVCSVFDKSIDLSKNNETFRQPTGKSY